MPFSAKCSMPLLAALATAASLLAARATDGTEPGVAAACPPVGYSAELQERAAAEVEMLPASSPLERLRRDAGPGAGVFGACEPLAGENTGSHPCSTSGPYEW